jgi:ribosomal protein S18 acetylase RimI-like enzyme
VQGAARFGSIEGMPDAILKTLEQYYDSVPRRFARAEDFGPLTLFVRESPGFPYYARPTLSSTGPASVEQVHQVRARQRELKIPEAFEWVERTSPWLADPVEASGIEVHRHPLMVLDRAHIASREGARILGSDDPAIAESMAAVHLGFDANPAGETESRQLEAQTAQLIADGTAAALADRIAAGITVLAAAFEDGRAVSAGQHTAVDSVTEIAGVATLPSARRRGHAGAVTAALVADALARGVETVFLSAGDDDVARIYASLGFVRVGTACIAEA